MEASSGKEAQVEARIPPFNIGVLIMLGAVFSVMFGVAFLAVRGARQRDAEIAGRLPPAS